MKTLKKENAIIYLFLNILTFGLYTFYIAYKLDLYDKERGSMKTFCIKCIKSTALQELRKSRAVKNQLKNKPKPRYTYLAFINYFTL